MSSLKKSVKTRTYKERSQPSHRRKLGLLEKHKDYVLRAKNFHQKSDRLKKLRLKAEFKNPDEFYFGMVKGKTVDGVHRLDKRERFAAEALKKFNDQDRAYVNSFIQKERKKIDKLAENLHMLDQEENDTKEDDRLEFDDESDSESEGEEDPAPTQSTHTIFVDSEKTAKEFDAAKHFDTLPELIRRKYNRPRLETIATKPIIAPECDEPEETKKLLRNLEKKRMLSYEELSGRIEREEKMLKITSKLQSQRDLMSKGRRKKVKEGKKGQPDVYKWKTERKR